VISTAGRPDIDADVTITSSRTAVPSQISCLYYRVVGFTAAKTALTCENLNFRVDTNTRTIYLAHIQDVKTSGKSFLVYILDPYIRSNREAYDNTEYSN